MVTIQEVGDRFRTITGLIDAVTIDEEEIEHEKGKEVLVIHFLTSDDPLSIEIIASSEKVMEKKAREGG